MNKYIITYIIILTFSIFTGCSNSTSPENSENTSWVFVANEGQYWSNINGSISMINDNNEVKHVDDIGLTVNSLLVHNDHLYVIVNQDNKILQFNISHDGIELNNSIDIENSGPREMVAINNKIFFTNSISKDVKIYNTETNQIEDNSISINGIPEDIIFDGTFIWVSVPQIEPSDGNQGKYIARIDPSSLSDIKYIDIGRGATKLTYFNNSLYASRTYYDFDGIDENGWWINEIEYHGTSKINGDTVTQEAYGTGSACGGSILTYNNMVYRSYEGGIAPLKENLQIDQLQRLGNYQQSQIYDIEIINNLIWFAITDYSDLNQIRVVDSENNEINVFEVGQTPGDIAYWYSSQ